MRATIPAACEAIVQRAMATDPENRCQSIDEIRGELKAILAAMSGAGIQLPGSHLLAWLGPHLQQLQRAAGVLPLPSLMEQGHLP